MRILLAIHGRPPEVDDGLARYAEACAHALAARGADLRVVAGSPPACAAEKEALGVSREVDKDRGSGDELDVRPLARTDRHPEHWQKLVSPAARGAFRALLEEWTPDVVHVLHWRGLTGDLVAEAARAGVPSVVSLHDHVASCLLPERIHSQARTACSLPSGPGVCVPCARDVAPRPEWIPLDQQFLAFGQRREVLARELSLARRRLVPSRFHAAELERFLGADLALDVFVPAPPPPSMSPPLADPQPPRSVVLGNREPLRFANGADLVLEAVRRTPDPARFELHLAGRAEESWFVDELNGSAGGVDVRFDDAAPHAVVAAPRVPVPHGFVLDDAIRRGIPAILPRAGAFTERVGEGSGVLFYEPGDVGDLARTLARLADEPDLARRLRAELLAAAARLPSLDSRAQALLALYAEVVREGPPAATEVPARAWFEERMEAEAVRAWDEACDRASAKEPASEGGHG